jgi:hypothetical protein
MNTMRIALVAILFAGTELSISGCGSVTDVALTQPTITTQPSSQSTPLGESATFSVVASGSPPLSYQWDKGGSPIPGATSATFVAATVQASDSGSTFTVEVSNAAGSITSDPATLTVGPRSPKQGDLRFQQVDSPSWAEGIQTGASAENLLPFEQAQYTNYVGQPFQLGPGLCVQGSQYDCSWFYGASPLPLGDTGLTFTYQSDEMENLASDLAAFSSPDSVVTTLDEEPANDIFAAGYASTTQATGFAMTISTVSTADLQSLATELGSQSQVITALSFNASGQVDVLSYSWRSDASTVYEVQVSTATFETAGSAAQQLAAGGYIVTAFGGNTPDGVVIVGTKVQGDTLPRPVIVGSSFLSQGDGFAPVALPYSTEGNQIDASWIFEE